MIIVISNWLVVWLPFFIFPYIGNNHPNWLIFFRGVAQPPTSKNQHVPFNWNIRFCDHLESMNLNEHLELRLRGQPRPWTSGEISRDFDVPNGDFHRAAPSYHPFLAFFHEINHPLSGGYPHDCRNPIGEIPWLFLTAKSPAKQRNFSRRPHHDAPHGIASWDFGRAET